MKAFALLVILLTASCGLFGGEGSGDNPDSSSVEAQISQVVNIMIVDDGFNLNQEVFNDKILDQFTVDCSESEDMQDEGDSTEDLQELTLDEKFEKLKDEYIKGFNQENPCKLEQSITYPENPQLFELVQYRDEWNRMLGNKASFNEIFSNENLTKIALVIDDVPHHGTTTASLIAYNNPNVKMVFLEVKLGDGSGPEECIIQEEVDLTVRVLRDPEIRDLYLNQEQNPVSKRLDEIVELHNIKLVNYSAASNPRSIIEEQNRQLGCEDVSLLEYFNEISSLDKALEEKRKNEASSAIEPLFIQSAGNEGAQIDAYSDFLACSNESETSLLVGSNEFSGVRSDFSNFGQCVDVYAVGGSIVSSSLYGFLNIKSGTSYSAPIVSRYVSQHLAHLGTAKEMKVALKQLLDSDKNLPESFPVELAYDNFSTPVTRFSLRPSPFHSFKLSPSYLILNRVISSLK